MTLVDSRRGCSLRGTGRPQVRVFLGFREEYDACVAHLSTLWLGGSLHWVLSALGWPGHGEQLGDSSEDFTAQREREVDAGGCGGQGACFYLFILKMGEVPVLLNAENDPQRG